MIDPQFNAGNIREKKFGEIWTSSLVLAKFRKNIVDHINVCESCSFKYICGGGCRAFAILDGGDFYSKDPYCDLYYTLFEHLIWDIAEDPKLKQNLTKKGLIGKNR